MQRVIPLHPIQPLASDMAAIKPPLTPQAIPAPPPLNEKSYVLIDAYSGTILAQKNMDEQLEPASLTKLMTLYIVSGALKAGQIHLQDQVPISEKAWRTGGSRMFIKAGTTVSVADLIQGIVVDSGNDATVAIAEYLGGSEEAFTSIMNDTAKRLGMKNTHFTDANGLPSPNHYSSAHDLAILARAIYKEYPEYYQWYGQKYFTYNNIKQANHNHLLFQDPTVDGFKTGFTDAAGYCLVASSKQGDTRLISVVMGAPNTKVKSQDTRGLLNYGFRYFDSYKIYKALTPLTEARVWQGKERKLLWVFPKISTS